MLTILVEYASICLNRQDSENELGFSTPGPINIIIFCEITAKQIPIITSLIFSITSSLTLLGLLTLMN